MWSTTVESFANPAELGPLYPFVGVEWLLVLIAVVLWLLWHWRNIRDEHREYEEAKEYYKQVGLERVMSHGGTALIPSEGQGPERNPTSNVDPPPLSR